MSPIYLFLVELLLVLHWETTLISGSLCDPDSGVCLCPANEVQYGGGLCQVEVTACDSVSPCLQGSCHDNYCYVSCPPDCKIEGFICKNGLCVPKCSSSTECPQGNCTDGGCTPPNGLKPGHLPDDPDCAPDDRCPDMFSKCNTDTGKCECSLGLRYSADSGKCEWLIDTVCIQCDPCSSHDGCFDLNMVCNTDLRVCVCKPGYKLDDTGESCSEEDHTITPIDCMTTSECSQLPFSVCDIELGKCQCIIDYCYQNRSCLPDQDDCSSIKCPGSAKCIDLRCSDNSQCVDAQLTQVLSWFDVQCEVSTECTAHSKNTYCYAGYCQCVKNAIYLNESCVRGVFCYSNVNCQIGEVCQFSRCIEVPIQAIATRQSGLWRVLLILGLLLILAICLAMYAVYRFALIPKLKRDEENAITERKRSELIVEQLKSSLDERMAALKSKEKRYKQEKAVTSKYKRSGGKQSGLSKSLKGTPKTRDTNTKGSRTDVKKPSSVNRHSPSLIPDQETRTGSSASVAEKKRGRRDSQKKGGLTNKYDKQNTSDELNPEYSASILSGLKAKMKTRSKTKVKQEIYYKASKAEATSQEAPPPETLMKGTPETRKTRSKTKIKQETHYNASKAEATSQEVPTPETLMKRTPETRKTQSKTKIKQETHYNASKAEATSQEVPPPETLMKGTPETRDTHTKGSDTKVAKQSAVFRRPGFQTPDYETQIGRGRLRDASYETVPLIIEHDKQNTSDEPNTFYSATSVASSEINMKSSRTKAKQEIYYKSKADKTSQETPAPKTPETSETPETPKTLETTKTSETPKTPETSKTPETPWKPEMPITPKTPETLEPPKTPESPKSPKTPETPETLQMLETLKLLKTPETPMAPVTPETSKSPEKPETPNTPEMSPQDTSPPATRPPETPPPETSPHETRSRSQTHSIFFPEKRSRTKVRQEIYYKSDTSSPETPSRTKGGAGVKQEAGIKQEIYYEFIAEPKSEETLPPERPETPPLEWPPHEKPPPPPWEEWSLPDVSPPSTSRPKRQQTTVKSTAVSPPRNSPQLPKKSITVAKKSKTATNNSKPSSTNSKTSATKSKASATNSKASATNSKASATNSKASAKKSKTAAKKPETRGKKPETSAKKAPKKK